MNIIEELLQARDACSHSAALEGKPFLLGFDGLKSLLWRAANTIQTLGQQVKDSEATATRYAEVIGTRTSTLRFLAVASMPYWLVVDTNQQVVRAQCFKEQDANEIAALLNKA